MHIDIPPKLEAFIQSQISAGAYNSGAEVARDAIRRMEREQSRLEILRTTVRAGDEQLDRGEGVLLTIFATDIERHSFIVSLLSLYGLAEFSKSSKKIRI